MRVLLRLAPLAAAPSLAQEGNPHNVKPCLVFHREASQSGVDAKATVTFRAGGWDGPALCATCHTAQARKAPEESAQKARLSGGRR